MQDGWPAENLQCIHILCAKGHSRAYHAIALPHNKQNRKVHAPKFEMI